MTGNNVKGIFFSSLAVSILFPGCNTEKNSSKKMQKPNVLCIVCEDISPYLGCYGDPVAKTPNLDRFATEAIRFTRMFTPVGVSAPSRSALITGMYPTSIGANHMRNYSPDPGYSWVPDGISTYEVVLPDGAKCYTEYVRAAGYYCTNNDKTDYQFAPPLTAWDESSSKAHWKNRPEGKPFFAIFNLSVTHESQIWTRTNEPLVVDPDSVKLPPYYPDDPVIRHDMAVLYSNIHEMDRQAQKLIDEVKEAGLLDNTIIIFYSDNGGPLPRGKRALYESGTLVPFMIRFPDGYRKGEAENRLCSFVDIPATVLSILEIEKPDFMQGEAFLGKYQEEPRQYVFGGRNRMDEVIDKMGYTRDAKYRYIRNYMPEKPNYMPNAYRLQMATMKRLVEMLDHDSLNSVQKIWFSAPRSAEEFYDVDADPFEVNNLINDVGYREHIDRLRNEYDTWDNKYNKLWKLSEADSREFFWPGGIQPVVAQPEVIKKDDVLILKSETKGASFAYQISGTEKDENHWELYTDQIPVNNGDRVKIIGVRVGYRNSDVIEYEVKE